MPHVQCHIGRTFERDMESVFLGRSCTTWATQTAKSIVKEHKKYKSDIGQCKKVKSDRHYQLSVYQQ